METKPTPLVEIGAPDWRQWYRQFVKLVSTQTNASPKEREIIDFSVGQHAGVIVVNNGLKIAALVVPSEADGYWQNRFENWQYKVLTFHSSENVDSAVAEYLTATHNSRAANSVFIDRKVE